MGAQLQPGQVFAGFRVHHRLGAGGMGDVYALWQTGKSVLGLWPALFPQTDAGKGYQGMVRTPNDERPSHRAVQNKYRFVCAARAEGFMQPTITVDLVVYNPGDRD